MGRKTTNATCGLKSFDVSDMLIYHIQVIQLSEYVLMVGFDKVKSRPLIGVYDLIWLPFWTFASFHHFAHGAP